MMRGTWLRILTIALGLTLSGCMSWDYGEREQFSESGVGLFVVNEGNFQYGNASLSYYDPATSAVANDVFIRANGMKLGDQAQSMAFDGKLGWVVVTNSHVVFAIDPSTMRERGRIENLPSPRYIEFVSPTKAYITQIWDNRIAIIDPQRFAVTGYITVPGMDRSNGSTEMMVSKGDYVYCNCWSYQSRIIKIDTRVDEVVAQLEVGNQPQSIAMDAYGRLWVLTEGSVEKRESPKLLAIDVESMTVVAEFPFRPTDTPRSLAINSDGDMIYWINRDVWAMSVKSTRLPVMPFVEAGNKLFYGLTVSPISSEVYVSDAIDYQQAGIVYRYSADGVLIDSFRVGIIPGNFCWKI